MHTYNYRKSYHEVRREGLSIVEVPVYHAYVICSSIVTNILLTLPVLINGSHHLRRRHREKGHRMYTTVANCLVDGLKQWLLDQGRRVSQGWYLGRESLVNRQAGSEMAMAVCWGTESLGNEPGDWEEILM